jgi:signal transduction histidine kinase
VAAVGLVLATVAVWVEPDPIGTAVAGPTWLRVVFPFLLAVPLAWRRTAPLGCVVVVFGAVLLQALVTGDSPEGLELIYCMGVAMFGAGAHVARGRSVLALVWGAVVYAVYAATNVDIGTGKASELWAGAFFAIALVAVWLAGVFVRSRRADAVAATREVALQEEVRQAVTGERARLARELHDVISHNLSVVVVQAAGARAAGDVDPSTLEKIERSGRESLVEMRRLLGVLRDDGAGPALDPQPGIGDLPALVESLRSSGVPVELSVDGDPAGLSPTLGLSVFRIVQEALTNTLKHAGPARIEVRVTIDADAVSIDVQDDGRGGPVEGTGGHGLVGMRERVALFDGELRAGTRPDGGFAVQARLRRRAGVA